MIPVILSGGSGTRLWPLSRQHYPKQFLPLSAGGATSFQETLKRLEGMSEAESPIVVANVGQRFLAAEQLLECSIEGATILLEPEGRNSAPALAAAALAAQERGDSRALLLALPADHVIRDADRFRDAIRLGIEAARSGHIVLFSVTPERPETAYGYLRIEARGKIPAPVHEFVEKPDKERAAEFVHSGRYFWNSGIFLLRADRYLKELEQHMPGVLSAVRDAYAKARHDPDFILLDSDALARSPSISIDFAVMEHVEDAIAVPLEAGWSDIGSWQMLASTTDSDSHGNVVEGDVFLEDSESCYVRAESRLVAVLGVRNHIVVETSDAVLVADRSRGEDVRSVVARLEEMKRVESLSHRRVQRPWGWYESMVNGDQFQVKHIMVKPGGSLSLQSHRYRAEHWVVVHGHAEVTRGDRTFTLDENESTFIPRTVKHRLSNPGPEPLEVIEVQSGSYLGEDDIVRLDDVYGRETV